ncbi:MAG TPA: SRPBCC domain-containing protein [Candidatus Saccharimonadia bacterium]|nr:SRPBCC domain-containing protein [Candidatus Saccharimonadia bacterium]
MKPTIVTPLAMFLVAGSAAAAVTQSSPSSFNMHHEFVLDVAPAVAWKALTKPGKWWPKAHTWSGDATNLTLEPRAGGCFCEKWDGGSAEHARVIMARPNQLLRMHAPLGPLQEMGLSVLLTITLEPAGTGTKATVAFRASGDESHHLEQLAPVVDRVVGEQWARWAAYARDGKVAP